MLYWLALSTKSNTIRLSLPSARRMPRPSCWVYSTFDIVGRAMNNTSVSGQSQPSFSRSQAHSTSSFFWANRWVASLRSASFMPPETASAGTPRSFSSAAICSACLMDAQKMTVRLSRTNSIQVSTISWLRSGTKILLSRSRMLGGALCS